MNNIHRSSFAIACDEVHAVLLKRGKLDLGELHAAMEGEHKPDQLREALDQLRLDRRLQVLRDAKSRTLFQALVPPVAVPATKIAPKPAPPTPPAPPAKVSPPPPSIAVKLAPTIKVTVVKEPQGAKSGSADPAPGPKPREEGGAAPTPPRPSPVKAARGTQRALALQLLEEKGPMDRHQLAALMGKPAQNVSVLLSELKLGGAVKTDGKVPARFALPQQDFPPLVDTAAAPRPIQQRELKVATLERLRRTALPSDAAVLNKIIQDLNGAAA